MSVSDAFSEEYNQNSFTCTDAEHGNIEVKININKGLVRVFDKSLTRGKMIASSKGRFTKFCRYPFFADIDCDYTFLVDENRSGYMRVFSDFNTNSLKKYFDLNVSGSRYYGWCR